ncbi:hypothetical protein MCG45_16560 [Clostridium perfringens]|uniref:hypothetical protein n=1 Tax=Clostridium perfringens TaxID=1502 RepID=UPI001F05B78D|nr:hypothetical protein [Clostridium perfringens]MCH1964444.1 hypothetical protein [Clostridium perfringens]
MNLKLIKNEIDSGGVFIGEYKEISEILKYIDREMIISFSLIHHKAIELKKIDNNYVINPCL